MAIGLLSQNYESNPAFPSPITRFRFRKKAVDQFNSCFNSYELNNVHSWNLFESLIVEAFELDQTWEVSEAESAFLFELAKASSDVLRDQRDHYLNQKRLATRRAEGYEYTESQIKIEKLETHQFYIEKLSSNVVSELIRTAEIEVSKLVANANAGKMRRSELSVNEGPAVRKLMKILNKAFRQNGTLEAVSRYAGQDMRVGGLAIELSDSRSDWWKHALEAHSAPKTMYAHVDEAVGVPKSIVYLSNVTNLNGPTSCYPGALELLDLEPFEELIGRALPKITENRSSLLPYLTDMKYHQPQSSKIFRKLFIQLPSYCRFYSHFGWDVVPESQLENELSSLEVVMTGNAGTHVVFDGGRLLHRGGLIESGERIALQILFRSVVQLKFRHRFSRKFKSLFWRR